MQPDATLQPNGGAGQPPAARVPSRGVAYWFAVFVYVLPTLPMIPAPGFHHSLREQYLNVNLPFKAACALCVFFLLRRDARAQWPANAIVAWLAMAVAVWIWTCLHIVPASSLLDVGVGLGILMVFVLQARYISALRRQRLLR